MRGLLRRTREVAAQGPRGHSPVVFTVQPGWLIDQTGYRRFWSTRCPARRGMPTPRSGPSSAMYSDLSRHWSTQHPARVYLPNRISLAEMQSDVRARRYVKIVVDVQRGNRSGSIGSSRFPLRSAPLRSAPLRSAPLRFAPLRSALLRFALNREHLSLLIAPRSLFVWLGLEVATRDALSHLQPQPGVPGSLGTGGW